jgi:hypothetical protein
MRWRVESMTDFNKAMELFSDAGLAFPTLPEELAVKLKERDRWVFSTRPIRMWPYELDRYVHQSQRRRIRDYALLSHSGYGINSYAIQYYLVYGHLRMFLHLGWGGVYDNGKEPAKIRACFLKADEVVQAMVHGAAGFHTGERLTVVGSDFYGSYWIPPGPGRQRIEIGRDRPSVESPLAALTEVLHWLTKLNVEPSAPSFSSLAKGGNPRAAEEPPSRLRRAR